MPAAGPRKALSRRVRLCRAREAARLAYTCRGLQLSSLPVAAREASLCWPGFPVVGAGRTLFLAPPSTSGAVCSRIGAARALPASGPAADRAGGGRAQEQAGPAGLTGCSVLTCLPLSSSTPTMSN